MPGGDRQQADARAIREAGGQPVALAVADNEASVAQLEALFTEQREAEWTEFVADCGKYEAELASEVAKGKLTLAELDETPCTTPPTR